MSQFIRQFTHDKDGDPVMDIRRKIQPEGRVYQIPMPKLWTFSEEHNKGFKATMYNACIDAYSHLRIGQFMVLSNQQKIQVMSDLADVIQGGIEEFLSMPPRQQRELMSKRTPIGEVRLIDKERGTLFEKEIYAEEGQV